MKYCGSDLLISQLLNGIQMMGDTFDMFQCNEVFIFNEFDQIYDLQSKIGEGANSVVYEAIDKRNQNKFAVKITRKKDQ